MREHVCTYILGPRGWERWTGPDGKPLNPDSVSGAHVIAGYIEVVQRPVASPPRSPYWRDPFISGT